MQDNYPNKQWFTIPPNGSRGVLHVVMPPGVRARRQDETDEEYAKYLRARNARSHENKQTT